MLVETVLAILVISIITSSALVLFSTLIVNINVQNWVRNIEMCEICKTGDHLGFEYREESRGEDLVKIIGPISENADILFKALKKIQEKYSDCKFMVNAQEVDLSTLQHKKVTGCFSVGSKKT